jgi:SOS-response transcriptional repressor LexA
MQEATLEQVYAFCEDYIRDRGASPSVREISTRCGITFQRTLDVLSILEARGKIERIEGTKRNIRIPTHAAD